MNDPWTTVWGWTVGAGAGLGVGRERGKNWDSCSRRITMNFLIKNKNKLIKSTFLKKKD